jgi:predicted DNA-binding transcriptional regulator AlpA
MTTAASRDSGYGVPWHVTWLDGKVITWISRAGDPAVCAVLDPQSPAAARRVLADGSSEPLPGEPDGLTVYGRFWRDRPCLAAFAALSPDYAHLAEGIADGRGITMPAADDPLLTTGEAARVLGVKPETVRRYRASGGFPEPDEHAGRTPLWHASTITAWQRPGRGAGGGRPRGMARHGR